MIDDKVIEMIMQLGATGKGAFIAYLVFRVSLVLSGGLIALGIAAVVRNTLIRLVSPRICPKCINHNGPPWGTNAQMEHLNKCNRDLGAN